MPRSPPGDSSSRSLRFRFGEALKDARLARGLTQEQVSAACGMARTYLSAIEHGRKTVTIETAEALAATLDLRASELLALAESLEGDR